MPYRIVHRTSYAYDSPVSASYGELYLLPRNTDMQRVVLARVEIEPLPETFGERTDFFGNRAANFAVLKGHTNLTVTATSVVDVMRGTVPDRMSGPTWEEARNILDDRALLETDILEARQFRLDSPSVPWSEGVRTFTAESFTTGRGLLDATADLTARIHDQFAYEPGATDLATTPDDLLLLRKGVCQDFAHLEIACLRSHGLAARYVSGYLETVAPPGQVKLQGADVSHAWLSVFVPTIGWVDIDPTNNLFVGERHICTAWGRDYSDVSPLKGVIFTEASENTMTVTVDVIDERSDSGKFEMATPTPQR